MRSHDGPLAARELRRFIVLNGHNGTEKNWDSARKDKEEIEY